MMLRTNRRTWIKMTAGCLTAGFALDLFGAPTGRPGAATQQLKITGLRVTPIALPDPPLLFSGGCHGPYFLRNVIELDTDAGITGIGETHGGQRVTAALEESRSLLLGQNVFGYRRFAAELKRKRNSLYAGVELACLDALGRATGRRVCELLGGPVRERVEFASYLFYRYAADHPAVLADPRRVTLANDDGAAIDHWGEVRTPDAMADLAWKFHKRWGFRVHKLKAGVFPPDVEVAALRAMDERFGGDHSLRVDPNGHWTVSTAVRVGRALKDLPLEYYEDPVAGQSAMAEVRRQTDLPTSTNSCVTRFEHIPEAVVTEPIDVVLGDHHGWGGLTAFQTLGTMTEALGWGLSQHSNNHAGITMAAMIHAGAITPQLRLASDTHYVWLPEGADVIAGPKLEIREGHMAVPTGAGLGVTIDQDKLARAHEVYKKCGMCRRDDRITMRRIEPAWQPTTY